VFELDIPHSIATRIGYDATTLANFKVYVKSDFRTASQTIPDAEQAFYHATRLSAHKADDYHALGLRYLAYMQYEQRKYVPAYENIHKALRVTPNDHDTLYDTARYAAKTGRDAEAIQLLEKCIELRASTIVVMFSDEDFVR